MKRPSIKRKAKQKDPDLDAESVETLIWTCSACGADNPDSKQSCISCGGARAGDTATPKAAESLEERGPEEPEEPEPLEAPEAEKTDVEETPPEPPIFSFDTSEKNSEPPLPEPEITPFQPTPTPFASFTQSTATPRVGQGRYYMVFVNTPAQSLIKSKVPIEFDDFPVVSIGRSPENVVVIPDQEVSRKHAELTIDGSKLMLKDLNSKNGTYLYNGKDFQQVHDSVEVKPNSIVKFGTGTIVRLTSE
ncbi:MAG TPA: FHA domain-containing protein [Candidatus Bathyarchaeia archaeon]|nr:FHA domain-containing protein [Candidatus Bathyarchaeia archaeon]